MIAIQDFILVALLFFRKIKTIAYGWRLGIRYGHEPDDGLRVGSLARLGFKDLQWRDPPLFMGLLEISKFYENSLMKLKSIAFALLLSTPLVSSKVFSETPWLDKEYVEKRMERMASVQGDGPSQWRVIWTKEPSTKAIISWTTAKKGSAHKVRYGIRSTGPGKFSNAQEPQRSDAYSGADGEYYHHARISGLKPSTTYHFEIESMARNPQSCTSPPPLRTTGSSGFCSVGFAYGNRFPGPSQFAHGRLVGKRRPVDRLCPWRRLHREWEKLESMVKWLSQHEWTVTKSGKVLPIIPTGEIMTAVLCTMKSSTPRGGLEKTIFTP